MRNQLVRAMNTKETILIYYVDGAGHITERYIRVLEVKDNYITAYCFWRKKARTFSITGILTAGKSGNRVI